MARSGGGESGELSIDRVLELMDGLLPEAASQGYALLLERGDCSEEDAARLVGAECLAELLRRGLAHPVSRDSRTVKVIRATDPTLAFHDVLHELQSRLTESSNRLLDAHQRIGDIQRIFARRTAEQDPEDAIRLVTDRQEIQSLSVSLINMAQSDYMGLHTWRFVVAPRKGNFAPRPPSVLERKVRRRSIYSTEYFDNEVGYVTIQTAMSVGDEVRIHRHLPMKLKLIDEDAALLPLSPTGVTGVLLVRAPVVVKALRQYFELLWHRATPVGDGSARQAGEGMPSEIHRQVLKMMALGMKDESIANRTGMSLRTVRRHIATIMEMLSVETRFAAGVTAAKRGWVE
ncbi:LuxR C-terminal-related transcriptional regulator [Nonomuraea sp. NPDC050310]|uniref:helix-turn-helix transcriptional regulator n=1 Tax=unclassified Nonomuraea TaxID=2593643 RepID=UPI0033DF4604